MPQTRSRLLRIEPTRELCTTWSSHLIKANVETMSSIRYIAAARRTDDTDDQFNDVAFTCSFSTIQDHYRNGALTQSRIQQPSNRLAGIERQLFRGVSE